MAFTVCIRGIEVHCEALEELDALIALAQQHSPRHQTARDVAAAIRMTLGEPKPEGAEWTFEYALDRVLGLQIERNAARDRVDEVTHQRERCDRRIAELEGGVADLSIDKMAERAVYAITGSFHASWDAATGKLYEAWGALSSKTRAEVVTTWIEQVETALKK